MTVSLRFSRNLGSVVNLSLETALSSPPASSKYSSRKSLSSVLLERGFVRLSKACWISESDFFAGLVERLD